MPIRVIAEINDAGKTRLPVSEDWVGVHASGTLAWLLDGASPSSDKVLIPNAPSDARWLVCSLSKAFHEAARTSKDLKTITEKALQTVRSNFEKAISTPLLYTPVNTLPSAAGILMHYDEALSQVNFLGLGDCTATVMQDDQIVGKTTPTLSKEDENARIFPNDKERTKAAYHAWKNGMNSQDGYWIFSIAPEAARHAKVETFDINPSKTAHVLLMSDGFERLIDPFNLHTHETLARKVIAEQGLKPTIATLRETEKRLFGQAEPKLTKMHDDASAILFEITPR